MRKPTTIAVTDIALGNIKTAIENEREAWMQAVVHEKERADAAEREVDRLRTAVRLYAKHADGCPVPEQCLCGLWNLQYPDKTV